MKKIIAAFLFVSVFIFSNLTHNPLCAYSPIISNKYPVDLSFLVIDLKFNHKKGVQICEIQQGICSRYAGLEFLQEEKGLFAKTFTDVLSSYQKPVWFFYKDVTDDNMQKRFHEIYNPFQSLNNLLADDVFVSTASSPVNDPHTIGAYHGIYVGYIENVADSLEQFRERFPGIIPIDSPFAQLYRDKLNMNRPFSEDGYLKHFKPACSYFKKGYTPTLAQEIIQTIGTNTVVIKPIAASGGKGVIIVTAKDLDSTLKYIFSKNKKLRHDSDPSYNWWSRDKIQFSC
jgi:hypothetical protein